MIRTIRGIPGALPREDLWIAALHVRAELVVEEEGPELAMLRRARARP
jgi:hypothetical protein